MVGGPVGSVGRGGPSPHLGSPSGHHIGCSRNGHASLVQHRYVLITWPGKEDDAQGLLGPTMCESRVDHVGTTWQQHPPRPPNALGAQRRAILDSSPIQRQPVLYLQTSFSFFSRSCASLLGGRGAHRTPPSAPAFSFTPHARPGPHPGPLLIC